MREAERLYRLKLRRGGRKAGSRRLELKRLDTRVPWGCYRSLMTEAGFCISSGLWLMFVFVTTAVFSVLMWNSIGIIAGVTSAVLVSWFMLYPYMEMRAEVRRQEVVPHIPLFLDALVKELTSERDVLSAVRAARDKVPIGLFKKELDYVFGSDAESFTLTQAVSVFEQRLGGHEIARLASVLRMFEGMRPSLVPALQRLQKMLESEQETFLATKEKMRSLQQMYMIVLLLFVVVPFGLIILSRAYIPGNFTDSLPAYVMQCALSVQLLCVMLLERVVMRR